MIRIFLSFLFLFGLFFFGIKAVKEMSGNERWNLMKYLTYSFFLSIITMSTMIAIVVIF